MADNEIMNSWAEIRDGVSDVERLIGHRQYNLAMIRARQTLEFMVRCLAERSRMSSGELKETIEELYENRVISKTTREHYHTIRALGNKAVHEGYDSPTGANNAYHLLSQELYTFASDYTPRRARRSSSGSSAERIIYLVCICCV